MDEKSCFMPDCFLSSKTRKEVAEFASLEAYMKPVPREIIPNNQQLFSIRGKGIAHPQTGKYFVEALIIDPGESHGYY